MSASITTLRIGTRESKLARLQTDMIATALQQLLPAQNIEIIPINTKGDKVLDRPLFSFGGAGVFVKELEEALLNNTVDLVVHSLKDLPTEIPAGLHLAATVMRDDPRDVLVSNNHTDFANLPSGSRVATSSRRRMAQLRYRRPDLRFVDIRGNVPTRLGKLDSGHCDAIILAAAGLIRLQLQDRISQFFEPDICMPAVGQGALALECRADDQPVRRILSQLHDAKTHAETLAERAFLQQLGGGCSVPIGALARQQSETMLTLTATISDGQNQLHEQLTSTPAQAEQLGRALAEKMISQGGKAIVEAINNQPQEIISPP